MKSALPFEKLSQSIDGEFYSDNTHRILYSTDASSYREMPLAVVLPKHKEDVKKVQIGRAHV